MAWTWCPQCHLQECPHCSSSFPPSGQTMFCLVEYFGKCFCSGWARGQQRLAPPCPAQECGVLRAATGGSQAVVQHRQLDAQRGSRRWRSKASAASLSGGSCLSLLAVLDFSRFPHEESAVRCKRWGGAWNCSPTRELALPAGRLCPLWGTTVHL